jgi:hypothetical protein
MSKTFREGYYEEDSLKIKRIAKTHKQKRQKVRDYIRQIELGDLPEEDDEEFEETNR